MDETRVLNVLCRTIVPSFLCSLYMRLSLWEYSEVWSIFIRRKQPRAHCLRGQLTKLMVLLCGCFYEYFHCAVIWKEMWRTRQELFAACRHSVHISVLIAALVVHLQACSSCNDERMKNALCQSLFCVLCLSFMKRILMAHAFRSKLKLCAEVWHRVYQIKNFAMFRFVFF